MAWVIGLIAIAILGWMFMRGAAIGNEAADEAEWEYFDRGEKHEEL